MRHGGLIAFLAGTVVVLVLVGVVPGRAVRAAVGALPWGGTERTTFYTGVEVKLAASRAGLRVGRILCFPDAAHSRFPLPAHSPRMCGVSSRGLIRLGRFHEALFSISVVVRQPNLDATWNRRVLRNVIKDYKWQAAHHFKQFHVRRANVTVFGRRGLSPELREQLVQTLRFLPDHGDATVIG